VALPLGSAATADPGAERCHLLMVINHGALEEGEKNPAAPAEQGFVVVKFCEESLL